MMIVFRKSKQVLLKFLFTSFSTNSTDYYTSRRVIVASSYLINSHCLALPVCLIFGYKFLSSFFYSCQVSASVIVFILLIIIPLSKTLSAMIVDWRRSEDYDDVDDTDETMKQFLSFNSSLSHRTSATLYEFYYQYRKWHTHRRATQHYSHSIVYAWVVALFVPLPLSLNVLFIFPVMILFPSTFADTWTACLIRHFLPPLLSFYLFILLV